jgi:hypothetical protein
MSSPLNKNLNFDTDGFKPEPPLEFQRGADAAGYWFAAAGLFAVLAAGIIVYRSANSEFQTASNDPIMPAAAQADPINPAPLLQAR